MKQEIFTRTDKLKAMAIVHVFETGKPFGDYDACVVLDDGAGVSYGINQFTHRSGSLLAVVEKYLASDAGFGRELIVNRFPILRRTNKQAIAELAADTTFKNALKAAASTKEMRGAQEAVAFERYLRPAIEECERVGFAMPLSLAVVYDSIVHGSWERLRDRTGVVGNETDWIRKYVTTRDRWLKSVSRLKKTSYRTQFFLGQIATSRWRLELPMNVHGVRLTEKMFPKDLTSAIHNIQPPATADGTDKISPVGPDLKTTDHQPAHTNQHDPSDTGCDKGVAAPAEQAQPADANCLDKIEETVNEIAARVDQADRIVTTTATRTARAQTLWTTIAAAFWQIVWAVGGFFAGVPREVWLVVAVIAALLMLIYLYRVWSSRFSGQIPPHNH